MSKNKMDYRQFLFIQLVTKTIEGADTIHSDLRNDYGEYPYDVLFEIVEMDYKLYQLSNYYLEEASEYESIENFITNVLIPKQN